MRSPVPAIPLKQGWVTDGISATQRIVGGSQPLLCITITFWAHFSPFPSFPLPFVISPCLSPVPVSDDFTAHTYTLLALLRCSHLALQSFTSFGPRLIQTPIAEQGMAGAEGHNGPSLCVPQLLTPLCHTRAQGTCSSAWATNKEESRKWTVLLCLV